MAVQILAFQTFLCPIPILCVFDFNLKALSIFEAVPLTFKCEKPMSTPLLRRKLATVDFKSELSFPRDLLFMSLLYLGH